MKFSLIGKQEVLLDVSRLFGRAVQGVMPTGVDRVTLAYVAHYQARARAVLAEGRYIAVLSKQDSKKAFDLLLQPQKNTKTVIKRLINKAKLTAWYPLKVHERILINTAHTGIDHASYAINLRKQGVKLVFMVHDVIPITHPEFCRPNAKKKHLKRIDNMLSVGDGIITNSQSTLDTLQIESQALSVDMPSAVVGHLAAGFAHKSYDERLIKTPYFVMLGTIEPRKNHHLLFRIWTRLVAEMGEQAPKLVLVGRRGWECENAIDILERSETLRDFLIEKNECTDDELGNLLHHAQAMLFPSLVEGYGMPIVEALMVGTPVIASDLPVFHEIAGAIPDYLDVLDGLAWLAQIKAYMDNDHPMRTAQLARMQKFIAPSWPTHFEKVDAFIDDLVQPQMSCPYQAK